ncbi:PREDICTED: cyclin-dependent kinase inhibitor 1 [Acanthisitta chloris]|uniref:cyclin-dependent kinase inhibitor 1 n=1 Tax=Acanthisitta chloris TaxID=57068 RepID=UPI0004F0EF69|nr:PREDICTED: cyclin-dependent kinase inhibitor 1 [Acanthisitta chloris]
MPLSLSKAGQTPCSTRVCRNLFGPVDHQQLQNDLEVMLRQNLEEAKQRWNFDFETETPLEGPFTWECIYLSEKPQEVHSLVTGSDSRSSLIHKDRVGRICPKESQQSSDVYRAHPLRSQKRGQTTMKDYYNTKRRIVPDKPKP